jgi:hypothetical protein
MKKDLYLRLYQDNERVENANFALDVEKIIDFTIQNKKDFLANYSYLTEYEYINTKNLIIDLYLDFLNNFLTLNAFAEHYEISLKLTNLIFICGKKLNNEGK